MAHSAALVCVVDADASTRNEVRALLAAIGADVRVYASARAFLASLAEAVPACVVADAHLPDLSGRALLQELRARGLRIPTILLSAEADVVGAVEAMRAGALDYIEKPYVDRALVNHVAALIGHD